MDRIRKAAKTFPTLFADTVIRVCVPAVQLTPNPAELSELKDAADAPSEGRAAAGGLSGTRDRLRIFLIRTSLRPAYRGALPVTHVRRFVSTPPMSMAFPLRSRSRGRTVRNHGRSRNPFITGGTVSFDVSARGTCWGGIFFNTDICTTTGLTIYSGSLRMAFLMVSLPPRLW